MSKKANPPARMLSGMSPPEKEEWIKQWRTAEHLWQPIRAYINELRQEKVTKLIKPELSTADIYELRAELRFIDEFMSSIIPYED